MNLRHSGEEVDSFLNRHFKNIINALALVLDLKRFAVISCTVANLAWNKNIRQKVHFNLHDSVALAGLAAAALDVK